MNFTWHFRCTAIRAEKWDRPEDAYGSYVWVA